MDGSSPSTDVYLAIFHDHPQPMLLWSAQGPPVVNRALLSLLDYPEDQTPRELLPKETAELLRGVVPGPARGRAAHLELRGADGRLRELETTLVSVEPGNGAGGCLLAIFAGMQPEPSLGDALIPAGTRATHPDGLEMANRRLSFLLEASRLLTENLDYEANLRQLARIAVPSIADWCAVDILDPSGVARRLAVVHTDPAKVELAFELQRRYPPDPAAGQGVYHTLATGEPQYLPDISEELLVAATRDEEHLRLSRELGLRSVIISPLSSRGKTIGALTLVMAESGRDYARDDLELATELSRRAAIYIENSRLHSDLQAEVRLQTEGLRAANEELEAFTYSVSHDLRAPLRHLSGFMQLLKEGYAARLDEMGRHYLETVLDASKRMGLLIDDLLDFSRIARAELRYRRVDLTQIVERIAAEATHAHPGREIEWKIAPLPVVSGDPSMLSLVFQNLIDNAVKFTSLRERAVISLTSERREEEVIITVSDNGAGFDERYANKLFGVFQRLHSRNEFEGTGIGLANVRRIVERHHGRVWATGKSGEGATFSLSLPATRN